MLSERLNHRELEMVEAAGVVLLRVVDPSQLTGKQEPVETPHCIKNPIRRTYQVHGVGKLAVPSMPLSSQRSSGLTTARMRASPR